MTCRRIAVVSSLAAVCLVACGSSDTGDPTEIAPSTADDAPIDTSSVGSESSAAATQAPTESAQVEELFPDVIDASASFDGSTWTVAATMSSPYDSPQRYADAWRVVGPNGTVYAERILTHDHANEQPFTRSQSGIEIPDDVTEVTIEGRDQVSGYGGQTFVLRLTR